MSEQATPDAQRKARDEERLQAELASSQEQVLRLRDLLIAKDAEMGVLRGRVAELEAGVARILNLPAKIRSLLPGFLWRALGAVRGRLR